VLSVTLEARYKYSPSHSVLKMSKATVVLVLLVLDLLALGLTANSEVEDEVRFFAIYVEGLL
jgi:hypothetical protein